MTHSDSRTFTWDAADYAANSASQHAWARELIARLALSGDEHILDAGCGDGKITAELARAVPRGSTTGIDVSPEMIRFARKTFSREKFSNLNFHILDARRIRLPRHFNIVFSNAALHWVNDHRAFLDGASRCLLPGGRLMVSCGGKGNAQDMFLAFRAELRLKRWRQFFRKMEKPYFFYAPEDYRVWLPRYGFTVRRLKLTDKDMELAGLQGLAAWLRTAWHPYTQRVPEALREQFIAHVAERYVSKHLPDRAGQVHVRMVRLEIEAARL